MHAKLESFEFLILFVLENDDLRKTGKMTNLLKAMPVWN